jgi:hypothetical protein
MTDRDVIERVAGMLGITVLVNARGAYRTEYAATLKGAPAVALMRDLYPLMGNRRRQAIADALVAWTPPPRKLSFPLSEEIRRRSREGASVSSLAREYRVSRSTVRAVIQGRIYRRRGRPWRSARGLARPRRCCDIPLVELTWLAGWLEGECSFLAPPPSDRRRPRIQAQSVDRDVIDRVAALFGVTPTVRVDPRGLKRGWSPMFEALARGVRATEVMMAIEPLMGLRRRTQIQRAVRLGDARLGSRTGGVLASTWS